jgi:hypothetical protein
MSPVKKGLKLRLTKVEYRGRRDHDKFLSWSLFRRQDKKVDYKTITWVGDEKSDNNG